MDSKVLLYSILPSTLWGVCKEYAKKDEIDHVEKEEIEEEIINPLPQYKFEIDMDAWETNMKILTSMNRYAAEGTDIQKAGAFLVSHLSSLSLSVSTSFVDVKDYGDSFNVIAELKGTKYPEKYYVIGAHYDSISEKPLETAPGALDNASGTVAVLEMARILSQLNFPFSIYFILFTGEEHGLLGSKKFVQDLYLNNTVNNMKLMLNMDMVAFSEFMLIESPDITIFSTWKEMAVANKLKPSIRNFIQARTDHQSFSAAGIRVVHTGDNRMEYRHYHKTTDVLGNLNFKIAKKMLNMNVLSILRIMELDLKELEM